MDFFGIDLGWMRNPSGLARLSLSRQRLQLTHLSRPATHSQLLATLDPLLCDQPAWIGLDAPVLITNPSGSRAADRATHSLFSRQHAGAYPVNLNLPFATPVLNFVENLKNRGFATAPPSLAQSPTRHLFEVYPHAASLRLFNLPQILPFKKGPLASRLPALLAYRELLATQLAHRRPAFRSKALPLPGQTLASLKACEDQLDAVLCAYIAAHFWFWGLSRTNLLGDPPHGFIVNPSF